MQSMSSMCVCSVYAYIIYSLNTYAHVCDTSGFTILSHLLYEKSTFYINLISQKKKLQPPLLNDTYIKEKNRRK